MANYTYLDTKEVAARIRRKLKQDFKGHKFNVRISRYSMGSSVSVEWTDGPNEAQVQAISKPYDFYGFDGMQDLRYDKPPRMVDGEMVQASCNISLTRRYSAAVLEEALKAAAHCAGVETLTIKPSTVEPGSSHIAYDRQHEYPYLEAMKAARAWTAYPQAPIYQPPAPQLSPEEEARQQARAAAHAQVVADVEDIKAELNRLALAYESVTQIEEGRYVVTRPEGVPLIGSVESVKRMAARRAPAPAGLIRWVDVSPSRVLH